MGRFQSVARASEIPEGGCVKVDLEGAKIALFNVGGRFCAIEDNCNHRGGPLSEGTLEGTVVTCPWHGAQFDVTTGEPLRRPASVPMKIYPVQLKDGEVQIEA
jgi:nitrite reductase/ring-hydroxylating ferredoxin subunit